MENENSTKELDLIDIIKICWGWFVKFIWNPFLFVLRFIFKKWWVGLCAIILGFGIAILISFEFPKYTGHVIFKNNVCSSTDFINNVRFMSHASPLYQAEVMGIDVKDAICIRAMWGHQLCYTDSLKAGYEVDINDSFVQKGMVSLTNMFDVEICVTDKKAFQSVQDGLVRYFNSSEYFINSNKQRIVTLNNAKENVNSEMTKLDSIRNNMKGGVASTTSIVNGQAVSTLLDPTVISREMMRLSDVTTSYGNSIDFSPNIVDIVSPIKYNDLPYNFFLATWRKYVILSLVVCYVLALLIVYRKQVKSFIKG